MERAVLAAALKDPSGATRDRLAEQLHPFMFQNQDNRELWSMIRGLSGMVDEVSLAQAMGPITLEHWGGLRGLFDLTQTVATSIWADKHAESLRKLNKKAAYAEAMSLAKRDIEDGHEPEHAFKVFDDLDTEPDTKETTSLGDAARLAAEHFLAIDSGDLDALATPWPQLNTILGGGLMPGLTIIAARPSVGKTALSLSLATHFAKRMTTAFVSLEMSASQLAGRVIQSTSAIRKPTGSNFYTQDHRMKLSSAPEKLDDLHLQVFDSTYKADQVVTAIEKLRPKVAFIDYLQLLEGSASDENRAAQVSAISRKLKLLSLSLDLPLVALSQLNREAEKTGRSPRLSDLRESGSIEQDADVVIFLSRVEDEDTADQEIKVEVAKNRSGPTGRLKLTFQKNYQTWKSAEEGKPF